MDELTLDTDQGPVTLKMGVWLNVDPVRIHRLIVREKVLQVDVFEVLNPLVSKLRRADPEYYKRFMGLKLVIDYPGYGNGIQASIPFENDPVGFYKWWRKGKHEDKVYLSLANQIRLFQKVNMMDPKMILKKDLEILKK
ncbi:dEAD/DEAH box helicase domain-containing protein [Bacteroides sp. CAG:1060]|nr:dEAD/DEAH box helicase domain-containing protein [Bacteroides sp. CAG:1060]